MASNLMRTIKQSNKKSILFFTRGIYSVDGYTAHNSLYKLSFHGTTIHTIEFDLEIVRCVLPSQTQHNRPLWCFWHHKQSGIWEDILILHNFQELGPARYLESLLPAELPCNLIRRPSQARQMNLVIFWEARELTDLKSWANVLDSQKVGKKTQFTCF